MTSTAKQEARKTDILLVIAVSVFWLVLVWLAILYTFAGDKTAFGEFFTIWPPLLWLFVLVPLAILIWRQKRPVPFLIALAGMMTFVILFEEWSPPLRGLFPDNNDGKGDGVLRVVTWNVNGADPGRILQELESFDPDICFLQESPGIDESNLAGRWESFQVLDAGDTAVVSRYPIRELETRDVGPWQAPQLLAADLPGSKTIHLVNVRLMLPSLILNPLPERNRSKLEEDNHLRVSQFPKLADLIRETSSVTPFILAGDFNTPARANSLMPIRQIADDVWPESGRGWGRTITADFPVSRIDMIWVSPGIEPIRSWTYYSPLSDHKAVVADIRWN